MTKKIFIKNNLKLEEKTHSSDIGIDVRCTSEPKVVGIKARDGNWKCIDFIEFETNLYIDCLQKNSETNLYIDVRPRSSISKYNLVLTNSVGLIDPEYRDQIFVRFKYILQPDDLKWDSELEQFVCCINFDKIYKNGDKICQLIVNETVEIEHVYVPELAPSRRSTGKFGSTGE
jgi:dUTPase